MEILREVLLTLHLIGMAVIVGGYFAVIRTPRVMPGMLHAAGLQLVTGLLLVGVAEMGDGRVDHLKVGVKLLVAILVTVCAYLGVREQRSLAAGPGAAGLAGSGSVAAGFAGAGASASAGGDANSATASATGAATLVRTETAEVVHPSARMAHLTFACAILNIVVAVFMR